MTSRKEMVPSSNLIIMTQHFSKKKSMTFASGIIKVTYTYGTYERYNKQR